MFSLTTLGGRIEGNLRIVDPGIGISVQILELNVLLELFSLGFKLGSVEAEFSRLGKISNVNFGEYTFSASSGWCIVFWDFDGEFVVGNKAVLRLGWNLGLGEGSDSGILLPIEDLSG